MWIITTAEHVAPSAASVYNRAGECWPVLKSGFEKPYINAVCSVVSVSYCSPYQRLMPHDLLKAPLCLTVSL